MGVTTVSARTGIGAGADSTVTRKRTLAIVGDSFTEQAEWITDSTGIYVNPKGWPWWLDYYTSARLDIVRGTGGADGIIGTGGDNTTDILANLRSVAIPMAPGYVIIQSASNDPSDFAGDSALSIANYQSMISACQDAGIYLILMTWCGSSASTAETANHQDAVNKWLRALQAPGVSIADTARAYVDTAGTYPSPLAALTADGNHPNTLGASALARVVADVINAIVTPRDVFPDNFFAGAEGTSAIVTNPLMLGTGGDVTDAEVSGSMADDYTAAGRLTTTAVLSKVARTDGIAGEWQRVVVDTVTYTNPLSDFIRINLTANTTVPTGLAVGDWVSLAVEVSPQSGATGRAAPCNPRLRFIGATVGEWVRHFYYTSAADIALDAGDVGPGVLRSPPYQVPAGVTSINTFIDIPSVASGASYTTDIGRVAVIPVP